MNKEPVARMARWLCNIQAVTISSYQERVETSLVTLMAKAATIHFSNPSRFSSVLKDFHEVCKIFAEYETHSGLLPHVFPALPGGLQNIAFSHIADSPVVLRHMLAKTSQPGVS